MRKLVTQVTQVAQGEQSATRAWTGWIALIVTLLVATSVRAAPKDETVLKLDQSAIDEDYLGMQFPDSVRKLRQGIAICGRTGCSTKVVAQLHRDLGVVYVGWKKTDEGKAHFLEALRFDPSIELPKDLVTPETKVAFAAAAEQAKSEAKAPDAASVPAPPPEAPRAKKSPPKPVDDDKNAVGVCGMDSDCPTGFCSAGRCTTEAPTRKSKYKKNWFGLWGQQDIVFLSGAKDVCLKQNTYACMQGNGTYYAPGQPTTIAGEQDQVKPGFAVATNRLLIAYDRAVDDSFTIGGRLGYAFGGGPTTPSGASFLPIHVEVRASLWTGTEPFGRTGLRPYFVASFGVAQVDTGVNVVVVETMQTGTLTAWNRSGAVFASGGLGFLYALGRNTGFVFEVRGQRMFPNAGTVIPLQLGYVVGL
jgi:hypothetical protein